MRAVVHPSAAERVRSPQLLLRTCPAQHGVLAAGPQLQPTRRTACHARDPLPRAPTWSLRRSCDGVCGPGLRLLGACGAKRRQTHSMQGWGASVRAIGRHDASIQPWRASHRRLPPIMRETPHAGTKPRQTWPISKHKTFQASLRPVSHSPMDVQWQSSATSATSACRPFRCCIMRCWHAIAPISSYQGRLATAAPRCWLRTRAGSRQGHCRSAGDAWCAGAVLVALITSSARQHALPRPDCPRHRQQLPRKTRYWARELVGAVRSAILQCCATKPANDSTSDAGCSTPLGLASCLARVLSLTQLRARNWGTFVVGHGAAVVAGALTGAPHTAHHTCCMPV